MIILIKEGANIDHTDSKNWTALHYAVYNNSFDAVKLLIDNGASTFIITKSDYQLAIHFAIIFRRDHLFFYLMKNSCQNKKALDSRGNTLMHYAARYGSKEMFKYLLKFVDVNKKNIHGRTAIDHATFFLNGEALSLLIKKQKGLY